MPCRHMYKGVSWSSGTLSDILTFGFAKETLNLATESEQG